MATLQEVERAWSGGNRRDRLVMVLVQVSPGMNHGYAKLPEYVVCLYQRRDTCKKCGSEFQITDKARCKKKCYPHESYHFLLSGMAYSEAEACDKVLAELAEYEARIDVDFPAIA